jgi:hypothetical protein
VANAATTNGNGSAEQLRALKAVFKDRHLSFRHCPQSKVADTRWLAGRDVLEPVDMPDGDCLFLERFELIACAPTAQRLMEQLA